jgi:alpha-beta hydrolase superfamily lysophospholipase
MHGLGSRLEHFAPLAEHLAARGIAVAGWNLRGQGLDPDVRRRGAGLDVEQHLLDLDDFLVLTAQEFPGIPIFLAGDSMGAQLALVASCNPAARVAGALLYVPVVALRQRNPDWIRGVLGILGTLLPSVRLSPKWFVNRGADAIPLSRVPERQRELDAAPYRLHAFSFRFLSDMGGLIERSAAAGPSVSIPVAVFSAGVDLFITPEQITRFVGTLDPASATHFHYPAAHHDLLHDPEQASVLSDSATWLDEQLRDGQR